MPTDTKETRFAQLVREQGRLHKWCQDKLGIGEYRFRSLLAGRQPFTVEEARRASVWLDVPIDEFLPSPERETTRS